MELVFKVLSEIKEPEIMSYLLLILAFGDTLTALMWRNKKDIAIFSRRLWVGFGLNLFGASVPYIVLKIHMLEPNDPFVTTALILWTLVFGTATVFSLAANYKLYSSESYEAIISAVPKILRAEIENKISKHDSKGATK